MQTEIGSIRASDSNVLLRMWSVSVPAGERPCRLHSHLCFEIALVEAGSGRYTVGNRVYPMETGDLFVFASNEQHCITDVGKTGLTIVNLHFEPRFIWGHSADSFSEANINFCFTHDPAFVPRIPAKDAETLRSLHGMIRAEFDCRMTEYALNVKSYLNLMLVELIRAHGYTGDNAALVRSKLHSIRRVITYIDLNPAEPLTLEQLSALAGMSPNYFSAVFHSVSGITLWEYINLRRIDMAIRLITRSPENGETPLKLIDIACRCGFNNSANFNKVFKRITGMTPREYRAAGSVYDV